MVPAIVGRQILDLFFVFCVFQFFGERSRNFLSVCEIFLRGSRKKQKTQKTKNIFDKSFILNNLMIL